MLNWPELCVSVQEEYSLLKELYNFQVPDPSADEVRKLHPYIYCLTQLSSNPQEHVEFT